MYANEEGIIIGPWSRDAYYNDDHQFMPRFFPDGQVNVPEYVVINPCSRASEVVDIKKEAEALRDKWEKEHPGCQITSNV